MLARKGTKRPHAIHLVGNVAHHGTDVAFASLWAPAATSKVARPVNANTKPQTKIDLIRFITVLD